MGDLKGFMKYPRTMPQKRTVKDRIKDYREIYLPMDEKTILHQAARCMDCGVPFCHSGCPLGNIIPDFNDAVYEQDWHKAYQILTSTNNFPEFTGRICPAPCEKACVLGINNDPVTIEYIEKTIAERAFEAGWVKPHTPIRRSHKTVAVVGSGPAGMAAADQLNKAGHTVTLFERNDQMGGLLRYGIPDFKLEKHIIDRRLQIMQDSGIALRTNTNIGVDIDARTLLQEYDAIVLTGGSTIPRDLNISGRDLSGIYFAMQYLEQSNRQVAGQTTPADQEILVKDKHVIVIGGGDTGADCVGTSNRKGAASVTQIELLEQPPLERHESTPWPLWPMQLRTSTSHEEGANRQWSILSKAFIGNDRGQLTGLEVVDIEWYYDEGQGRSTFREIKGTQRVIPCDLVFVAVGFLHPQHKGLLADLDVDLDSRGNVATPPNHFDTSIDKVFAAGDMRRGQSLVVWAISEGREAAVEVDRYLSDGKTKLNSKSYSKLLV